MRFDHYKSLNNNNCCQYPLWAMPGQAGLIALTRMGTRELLTELSTCSAGGSERRKKNDLAHDLTSLVMIQKPTSCDGTSVAGAIASDAE